MKRQLITTKSIRKLRRLADLHAKAAVREGCGDMVAAAYHGFMRGYTFGLKFGAILDAEPPKSKRSHDGATP